jgi:hypothetical protein
MTAIEKLAREICWREFAVEPTDTTKAAYWKSLPQETRDDYIADAKWLNWIVGRVPTRMIGAAG